MFMQRACLGLYHNSLGKTDDRWLCRPGAAPRAPAACADWLTCLRPPCALAYSHHNLIICFHFGQLGHHCMICSPLPWAALPPPLAWPWTVQHSTGVHNLCMLELQMQA